MKMLLFYYLKQKCVKLNFSLFLKEKISKTPVFELVFLKTKNKDACLLLFET